MPFELAHSHTWTVGSAATGDRYRIDLALPEPGRAGPHPLVVVLDGSAMFLSATEFGRTVARVTAGDLPPMAVVGITCDTPDHLTYLSTRFRDFTPVEWTLHGPFADDMAMVRHGTGGAGAFLRAVVDEVLPAVRAHLDVDPDRIGICGWSLSGLFASYAWRERPDVFSRLLAISPSLWWGDAVILGEPLPDRPPAHRAFVCAGEHEEGDVSLVWPSRFAHAAQREMAAMVRNARRFGERCTVSGATTETVVFAGEHHVTLQSAALARGLVFLYGS